VRGIPALLLFREDQVQDQLVGVVSRERIQQVLDRQLACA
jgi:hypothetical protein